MVDFVTLDARVWDGDNEYPYAHYYANSGKTVNVKLLDLQGNAVCSGSKNLSSGLNEISIGDVLYNCNLNTNIDDGYYVLQIGDYYITFIVSKGGSITNPFMNTDVQGKVKKIIVWDTRTGLYLDLPPDTKIIPLGEFVTFVYAHDDSKRLGKLGICQGTGCSYTDWARYAIVRIEIGFSSVDDMYKYFANYIASSDKNTAIVIGKIANSSKKDAVKIASMYSIMVPFGDLVNWEIDIQNLRLVVDISVRLGWGWSGVWSALKYALAGAVIGAGVAAGIGVAVGSFGAGALVGGAIAGASIALGIKLIGHSNDKDWHRKLKNDLDQGVNNVTKAYNDAKSALDYYHERGEISDEAYNVLKQKIETIRDVAIRAMKELYEDAQECYKSGYNDCKNKYIKYVIGSGLGGFVGGVVLGRR